MKPLPRTLLWRTFLLVALLMMISVVAWFAIFRSYEREPRARQLAHAISDGASVQGRTEAHNATAGQLAELLRDIHGQYATQTVSDNMHLARTQPLPALGKVLRGCLPTAGNGQVIQGGYAEPRRAQSPRQQLHGETAHP